jgi:hypothetical protein
MVDFYANFNKEGVFEKDFEGVIFAGTHSYSKTTDLKGFLKSFANLMLEKDFKDMLRDHKSDVPEGHEGWFDNAASPMEHADASRKRSPGMFEEFYQKWDRGNGAFEMEMTWWARRKISDFGWIEFKMNLQNHVGGKNVEVLEGNSKKILQTGKWEFRNVFIYKNDVVRRYLNNIKIVKDRDWLKKMYVNHIYKKQLFWDLDAAEMKFGALLKKHIEKYFA